MADGCHRCSVEEAAAAAVAVGCLQTVLAMAPGAPHRDLGSEHTLLTVSVLVVT